MEACARARSHRERLRVDVPDDPAREGHGHAVASWRLEANPPRAFGHGVIEPEERAHESRRLVIEGRPWRWSRARTTDESRERNEARRAARKARALAHGYVGVAWMTASSPRGPWSMKTRPSCHALDRFDSHEARERFVNGRSLSVWRLAR
jgi:hypothetical protein